MTAIRDVTDSSFEAEVLRSPRPVIVEYWAPWCGPCRMLEPVLAAIAGEHDGEVSIVRMNADENPQTMIRYGILAVPTTAVFAGGRLVKQILGAKSKSALLRDFSGYLS